MSQSANTEIKVIPDDIKIVETQISTCNVNTPVGFSREKIDGYKQDLTFDLAYNLEDSLVKTEIELNVTTEGANEQQATGVFHFIFIFKIENLEQFFKKVDQEGEEYLLHAGMGNAISSLTYSTSRGILLVRLQGTGLESFILPVIDPNKLFDN